VGLEYGTAGCPWHSYRSPFNAPHPLKRLGLNEAPDMEVRPSLKQGLHEDGQHRRRFSDKVEISQEQAVRILLKSTVNGVLESQIVQPVRLDSPVMEDDRQVQLVLFAVLRHGGARQQDFLRAWATASNVAVAGRPYAA
jgi:hypothetical protein